MLYNSMDEPDSHGPTRMMVSNVGAASASAAAAAAAAAQAQLGPNAGGANVYDEAVDLEPIDFEHFVDEPDMNRNPSERMFRVTFGESPPMRGR